MHNDLELTMHVDYSCTNITPRCQTARHAIYVTAQVPAGATCCMQQTQHVACLSPRHCAASFLFATLTWRTRGCYAEMLDGTDGTMKLARLEQSPQTHAPCMVGRTLGEQEVWHFYLTHALRDCLHNRERRLTLPCHRVEFTDYQVCLCIQASTAQTALSRVSTILFTDKQRQRAEQSQQSKFVWKRTLTAAASRRPAGVTPWAWSAALLAP